MHSTVSPAICSSFAGTSRRTKRFARERARTPMNGITWIHIAGGVMALAAGAVAIAARKGGGVHAAVGGWFCASMLVLGVTASILAPFKSPPDSPISGIMVCYFVAT